MLKNMNTKPTSPWLTSKQTQKHLKITGCELMHKRERGELVFKKQGNAYLYYFNELETK